MLAAPLTPRAPSPAVPLTPDPQRPWRSVSLCWVQLAWQSRDFREREWSLRGTRAGARPGCAGRGWARPGQRDRTPAQTERRAGTARMALSQVRSTRRLRQWVLEQLASGQFPGVVWDDPPDCTMFRIPWKHAGKQDFRDDEDAAFFKAWAQFKGRGGPGNVGGPAAWKTRLRCALNKSPEFEEVPKRSRLDATEPYKVYRLLPVGTHPASKTPRRGARQAKGGCSDPNLALAGGTVALAGGTGGPTLNTVTLDQCPEEPTADGSRSSEDSGIDASPSLTETSFDVTLELSSMPLGLQPLAPQALRLVLLYSGACVHQTWLPPGEFLVTPAPGEGLLPRVALPPATPATVPDAQRRQATAALLAKLHRGLLLSSRTKGIYVQRRARVPLGWARAPAIDLDGPVHLFSAQDFRHALEQHQQGLGPCPEHCVTLCLGEELAPHDQPQDKLITLQMEQAFALELLKLPMVTEEPSCLISLP
ncbi:interferon regulatory factor 9 isoform X1 [Alligator mississippiensis]|nr:interferon regulatory factor 9 isoform X1 [Alligator mississippiensis]